MPTNVIKPMLPRIAAAGAALLLIAAGGATRASANYWNPPDTWITSGTQGAVATTTSYFNFKSSERRSSFVCAMDGVGAIPCSSPTYNTKLSQGNHKMWIVAIDRHGNVDPSPATKTFSVDTVPPDTRIESGPIGTVTNTSASIAFSGSGGATSFQCRIDTGSWAGCGSPKAYSSLASGSHTAAVRSLDGAGNLDPTPASLSWTVQSSTSGGGTTGGGGSTGGGGTTGSCTVGLLSPGSWPGACWRPYADASPFNRPLPANPPLASNSAAVVSRMTGWGDAQALVAGHPGTHGEDYNHPIYYAGAGDPLYTIQCLSWSSSCEIDGMQVRIPPVAKPASGSDGHMAVIDQANGWEYDFWQVQTVPLPAGGGTINVSHGGRTRWGTADADGLGSNATAAHFALDAGTIRAEEWDAATSSGGGINHALFAAIKCSGGYSVYPAATGTTAASCSSFGTSNSNAPPMGARFFLDLSDAQINALAVPAWKKPILKAMANYGIIVGDTYANHDWSFGLMAESDAQYRAFGQAGKYAALGSRWGVGTWSGAYVFDIDSGVNWGSHLKMVAPCVSQGTC